MNTRVAGVLAFLMLVSLACQGILIPECRDCHVGKLAQEPPANDDPDCDHCEHLHGNPLGCSHRQPADSAVRPGTERAPQAPDAVIAPGTFAHGDTARPSPAPARAFPGASDPHAVSCGVLRC